MTADHHFVELFIKALKRYYGVNRDDELAIKLGVAKSTLSSWRRRVQIPKEIATRAQSLGVDVERLANVAQLDFSLQQFTLRHVYYYILLKLSAAFGENRVDLRDFAAWVAAREDMVCQTLGIGRSFASSDLSSTEADILWQTTFANDSEVVQKLWDIWQQDNAQIIEPSKGPLKGLQS